jgi:hypothetical protein
VAGQNQADDGSTENDRFELVYRYGSFGMREHFGQLRSAIARVRELDSASPAHSFMVIKEGHVLLCGKEILQRVRHPVLNDGGDD